MKNIISLLILAIFALAGYAQSNGDIIKIEFTTGSRGGYWEQVTVNQDSIVIVKRATRGAEETRHKRKTKKKEWISLLKSIKNISITKIAAFKSPTNDRAFDGAMHSSITITSAEKKSADHLFDNQNPHKELQKLLSSIQKIKKGTK